MNPIAWGQRVMPALGAATVLVAAASGPSPLAEPGCVASDGQTVISGGTNGAAAIFAADLDGDGDVDLLSASANDDKIAWYENDGGETPGFSERVISTRADGASAVHAADMDGDGDIDVLSASGNDDKIAWYSNNGASPPEFSEFVISTTASNAASVHAVDLDGDGRMDVLSASIDDNEIAWYRQFEETDSLGQPTGSFGFEKFFVTSSAEGASSVFAADIDGDGDSDVLSASRFDNKITWYERIVNLDEDDNETTTFERHDISDLAEGARSVHAADVDGDNDIDVLSASSNDDEITWYENVPEEQEIPDPENEGETITVTVVTFTKRIISLDADGAASVYAVDLDGDLDVDVLSASQNDGKIAWYRNDGGTPPSFTEEVVSLGAPGARSVYAAPIASRIDAPPVAEGPLLSVIGGTGPVPPRIDVVSASSVPGVGVIALDDKIAWYENDGGDPAFIEHPVAGSAVAPEVFLAVDVDADGNNDVIVGSSSDNTLAWYKNDGEHPPGFTKVPVALDVTRPSALFWEDVNGDGLDDMLVASFGDDTIAWYENTDGTPFPGFVEHVVTMDADGASSVFAGDLDGDEDVDILSASANDDKIAWYENVPGEAGAVEFVTHVITADALGARAVFAVDMDGDEDIDVLSASFDDDTIAWFENGSEAGRGGETSVVFTRHEISTVTEGALSVHAADLDGDGDVDVLSASAIDDTIAWFENFTEEVEDPEDPEQTITVRSFTRRGIDVFARFARVVLAADLNEDGNLDVVAASSGDDTVAWYENVPDPDYDPQGEDPPLPPTFEPHLLATDVANVRSVDVADVDGDGVVDVLSAFLFGAAWYRNDTTEICSGFDVNGDSRIDGVELIWLGKAFGESCEDPEDPTEWWLGVDANGDCMVDGDDLAILSSETVWGRYTQELDDETVTLCHFSCQ